MGDFQRDQTAGGNEYEIESIRDEYQAFKKQQESNWSLLSVLTRGRGGNDGSVVADSSVSFR